MIALYIFSLVLGGGFLGLSLFGDLFGGHGDVDLGGHVAGFDTDMHAELDAQLDAGHALDATGDAGHAGLSHAAAKVFSIRTITYSLFGFGAVGTGLTLVRAGDAASNTALLAVGTGLVSGTLINALFSWVRRGDSGALREEEGYSGRLGRVTLPIEGSGGKIVVEVAGREVELVAQPHASAAGSGEPSRWRRVLVVEMVRGVALVAPAEDDTYLLP
jgi:hypothetical protein